MRKELSQIDISTPKSSEEFDQFFNEFYPVLVIFANRFITNIHECEGIVQDVFIKHWMNLDETKKREINLKPYLYRSVYNKCIDLIRKKSVNEKRMEGYNYFQKDFEGVRDLIAESELKLKIEKSIAALPNQCRKIFLMSREDELTYKQIAQELDISVKTVEAQIGKALRLIREYLSEYIITLFYIVGS